MTQSRLVVLVAILASFVAFLDGSVINVALPMISKELGGGLATQQWVVDAYLITLGALMLTAGSLSDLFGQRKILAVGLAGFAITSLLCAVAPTAEILIISRGLQGIAGALLVPSSLALIIAHFKGNGQGKAIGTWTAWTGMAFLVGPLLGGFLVDASSWRLIFAINVVPVIVTLWLLTKLEITTAKRTVSKVDIVGSVLAATGLALLVFGLIEGPTLGWLHPLILGSLSIGAVVLVSFFLYERKTSDAMLPLDLFTNRNFSVGNIATIAIYGGLSVATFVLSVFLQQVGEYSAMQAGLALLPVTIIMFILSSKFGSLAEKFGPRLFMGLGPIVAAIGFVTMLAIDQSASYTTILPGILLFGLGLSITVAPLTTAILSSVPHTQAGVGSAVNNAIARIAGLVAIAGAGVITGQLTSIDSFQRGILFTAGLLLVGGVVSLIGITNVSTQKKP